MQRTASPLPVWWETGLQFCRCYLPVAFLWTLFTCLSHIWFIGYSISVQNLIEDALALQLPHCQMVPIERIFYYQVNDSVNIFILISCTFFFFLFSSFSFNKANAAHIFKCELQWILGCYWKGIFIHFYLCSARISCWIDSHKKWKLSIIWKKKGETWQVYSSLLAL